MLNKSQSISVRLSSDDYDYLMAIKHNGALTQSEKVRELICLSREQINSEQFTQAYISSVQAVAPYRALNKENLSQRSEVVDIMLDLVSEVAASIQTTKKDNCFPVNLESKFLPVALELITRLLPILLQRDNQAQKTTQINRLQSLMTELTADINQKTEKE